MKETILSSALLAICILAVAQVPQGLNYKAVLQTTTGAPVANATIQVKVGILSDTLTPVTV